MKSYHIHWTNENTGRDWNSTLDLDLSECITAEQKIDKIAKSISEEVYSKHGKVIGTEYIFIKTISIF